MLDAVGLNLFLQNLSQDDFSLLGSFPPPVLSAEIVVVVGKRRVRESSGLTAAHSFVMRGPSHFLLRMVKRLTSSLSVEVGERIGVKTGIDSFRSCH